MNNKLKKHSGALWNTLGSAMWGLNSFVMLTMVSRFTSVEQTGEFGIALTTAQILYVVGLFGVQHFQMTDYEEKYSFRTYAHVRVFSCVLMFLCCIGAIILLRFSRDKSLYTVALTLFMMLNVVGELYQSLFFQKNRLDLSGAALFHRTLWSLLVFCVVLSLTGNILLAIALQTITNLLLTLYYAVRVSPKFRSSGAGTKPAYLELIRECTPLFCSLLIMNVIISSSKYGVELVMDDAAQGYYNMLFMPAQVINLCSQFLFKPFLGRYSQLISDNKLKEFIRLLKRQLAIVAVFTFICCIAAYFLGTPVLGLIYGQDISAFSVALTLVVFGGGIFAICQLFYYVLVILRLQKAILAIYSAGLLSTVAITFFFVRGLGLTGAALSFLASHVVILLCYICVLYLNLRRRAHAGNHSDNNSV